MAEQRPDDVPLETCLVRYYEHQAKQLRSADQARHGLRKWCVFFAGALVSEVTPERQREFVASLRAQGLSDGYIRRILANGQAALNRAHREGEIRTVPKILLSLAQEADPRERVASIEEMARLWNAADLAHQRLYLLLAIGTLARPEAILQLTTFQVDCDNRLIRLNPPGRRQTKKRRPTVPMCDTLLPYLRAIPPGPVVQWQGKRLGSIRTAFKRIKARARLDLRRQRAMEVRALRDMDDRKAAWSAIGEARAAGDALMEISPYTIRHTMATELRRRGVPVWEVAGFLGHTSGYKTTERYAKFGPDHLAGAVRAIDDYFTDLSATSASLASGPDKANVRLSCVLAGPRKVVEPRGIEPLTSTMPL